MPLLPEEIPPDRRELVRLAGEGALAVNDQHQEDADKLFRQMIAAYPHEPGVHFLFGAFLLSEHPEEGIREMQRELEISPFHLAARVRLAEEYVKEGELGCALELATEAVKLDPKDASAHLAEGEALVEKGSLPAGVRELEVARDLEPETVKIRWALFRAYMTMGRSEDAGKEKAAIEKLSRPGSPP
jgi:predicted Zn-dependent protease